MADDPVFVTNGRGEASAYFRALADWEHDTLPEPSDYAEYERAKREQLGIDRYTPIDLLNGAQQ